MAKTKLPWFRVYSDILDERKLKHICRKTKQPKALVVGVWVTLLALANCSPKRGELLLEDDLPYTLDDLKSETGIGAGLLKKLIVEFVSIKILTETPHFIIVNWGKRQFKSDSSTERVRQYRGRNVTTPLQHRYGNVPDTDTDTDTDTETDTEAEKEPAAPPENIPQVYEQNIGALTPMIADKLIMLEDEFPVGWFTEAAKEAVGAGVRNLNYIQAILDRYKREGFKSPRKGKGKGRGGKSANDILSEMIEREPK